MKDEPSFPEMDQVPDFHALLIVRYGSESGVRETGPLESVLAPPRPKFGGEFLHTDLFEMAVAHAFHRAQNQPFVDGTKGAGLLAALTLLEGEMLSAESICC